MANWVKNLKGKVSSILKRTDDTTNKRAYLKKYGPAIKAGNENTPTYAQWVKSKEPVYFRGIEKETVESQIAASGANETRASLTKKKKPLETVRTKNISSGLKQAGLTDEEIARFRGKK